ncbi:MAG TPA: prepilin-type N-terminal cleavage/methylation domain-containing protein, partial [Acidimicrobiia bacterium]|nr:prepilin-type N-terminal cleavage/methylation domain-containing protein [Acidimicrobiia bacterium]
MNWILRNRRRCLRRLEGEHGFTIVELMVAIAIFAILMTAAALGMNGALNLTRNNRQRSVAANLAAQQMDSIAAEDFSQVPIGASPPTTQTVDSTVYTITQNSEWVGPTTSTSDCSGGANANPAYLRVTVTVTWPQMNGVLPVQNQTILTPPVGTYDANSGNIGVTVLDRNATPEANIPVTATDSAGNATTILTTPDGCAFFAYETPGTYTVTMSVAGYVTDQGAQPATSTVSVVAGSSVQSQFSYDRAATLQLTLTGAAGGTVPNAVPL